MTTIASSATPAAPHRPAPIRLTRRGRLVVRVALLLALTVLVAAFSLSRLAGAAQAGDGAGPTAVVVQPGETLWQIARAADPSADPRDVIADIAALNGLTGPIVAGQQLLLPA